MKASRTGFTVVEILVVLGIISLLVALIISAYPRLRSTESLRGATEQFADALRRAQVKSQGVVNDSQWGVYVTTTGATVFRGTSYASRTASFDETFPFPVSVTVTGTTEYVYTKFEGAVQTTGTTTLTYMGSSKIIGINERGTLSYN